MRVTERLYYERPELYAIEAEVLAVDGSEESPELILDRTIFFPGGGGQSCDLGSIGDKAVVAVAEREGVIRHRLHGACPFRAGDRVRLDVDAERRVDYSRQHTAEHLVASVASRLLGARTVSVHFGPERSLIDFDLPSISDEDLEAVEEEVDRIIAEDYPIRVHLCPPEDIASFPLRRDAPAGEELLRVVEIDGLDFTPCCGLHRSSTAALRLVRLLGSERYKGMTRVYFVAGSRAAADYRALSRIARASARLLGTSESSLPEAVAREAERLRVLELENGALLRERASMEAAAAKAGKAAAPFVARRYADRSAASLMETAKAFAAAGMTALLASLPELTVQVLSPDSSLGLGERLKKPLSASGGKGGGGANSFRAVLPDAESLALFMEAVEKELGEARP